MQKILLESKKEPAEMSPVERKQHAEKVRRSESQKLGDLFSDLKLNSNA